MYKHLKELRESLGLTQSEFGESVGVAKSTYNNYETGVRAPKSDFWISVAQKYNVTIDYLMGYSDDPHSSGTTKTDVKRQRSNGNGYDLLTTKNKATVDDIISALLARQREEEKPVENVRFIDLFDMPVSAGNGVYLEGYDLHPIGIVNTPEAARADYALRVSGDSMEPMFSDGDIVLVETMPQIPQKAIGGFIHNGEGYIKQLDGPYMRSLNPAYEPILANSDTIIKGRVLGKAELV